MSAQKILINFRSSVVKQCGTILAVIKNFWQESDIYLWYSTADFNTFLAKYFSLSNDY